MLSSILDNKKRILQRKYTAQLGALLRFPKLKNQLEVNCRTLLCTNIIESKTITAQLYQHQTEISKKQDFKMFHHFLWTHMYSMSPAFG